MDGSNFYTCSTWRAVRARKIAESDGICSRCGRVFNDTSKLIVHHKQYLTGDDYNNPSLAYSDDNLEVICLDCHNKEHDRFKNVKSVHIVFGPPLSGKSSFVKENKAYDDIVVDLDALSSAITYNEMYDKVNCLRFNVFALRDALYDQIYNRYGNWHTAWIVGGFPSSFDRDTLMKRFHADCILMDVSKEECLRRLDEVKDLRKEKKNEWAMFIEKWFNEYTPDDFCKNFLV